MLDEAGILNKLSVDVAYHSHHMHQVSAAYLHYIDGVKPMSSAGAIFYSSLRGGKIDTTELGPQ